MRLSTAVLAIIAPGIVATDIFDYIDPLIGTLNGGHVFPGATLPYGMAKAVADVDTELQGGFASDDGNITGFSHMHDSGTGGGASLGNFPLFAHPGCPGDELNRCAFTSADRATKRVQGSVVATPGYFSVALNNTVQADMTVANHTALYRFRFPAGGSTDRDGHAVPYSPLLLVELQDLSRSRTNTSVAVDPQTGRMTGTGTFGPSFGVGHYDLHFCADFRGMAVRDAGVFANNRATNATTTLRSFADGVDQPAVPAGAFVRFAPDAAGSQILARVGVSFVSTAQACANAEREIASFDFAGTQAAAAAAWRDKLATVQVDHGDVDHAVRTVFWSGLYRAMISPQDYTGENTLWESEEPYYDSFYCIWDSFRSIHPLLTLVDPPSQTRMVRSLIDVYRHEGWLPDCRMSLCKGFTQGGSNADVVLADALLKGLTVGIDWDVGYAAVVQDAEVEPPVWSVEGRGGLASWKQYGYIPADDLDTAGVGTFSRSISRTVEYAYNDFCIAQMAAVLQRPADVATYRARAGNWANLFQDAQRSALPLDDGGGARVDSGFAGFLQPRYLNGSFGHQDPALCQPLLNFTSCYLEPGGHETYEGGSWLYSFFAPHDMAALIERLGGRDAFVARLQYAHDTPGLLYLGDEQAFLLVFLFHYAGRPALSARYAHTYIPAQFNTTAAGLPGNDDSGAMGAFSTLTMLGLWPVAGQDVYLILPPFFPEVRITSSLTGKTATVRCHHFDAAYASLYIQNATLDGQVYTRNWLTHRFFADGGVLELALGPEESDWGTADADLPPSMSA